MITTGPDFAAFSALLASWLNSRSDSPWTEILRAACAGWVIEELVEYEDEIVEGCGHNGRSALIGFVARKP